VLSSTSEFSAPVMARIHVYPDGVVYLVTSTAANNSVSLAGITFRAV
jgi:hypothetical protein